MVIIDSKNLTAAIETELRRRGISKGEFYKRSGISSATFSQWKSGEYSPSKEKLKSIEAYFGVSADQLVSSEGQKKTTAENDDGLSEAKRAAIYLIKHMSDDELDRKKDAIFSLLKL